LAGVKDFFRSCNVIFYLWAFSAECVSVRRTFCVPKFRGKGYCTSVSFSLFQLSKISKMQKILSNCPIQVKNCY
jgi:hypothetical protein